MKGFGHIGIYFAAIWFLYLVLKPVYLFPKGLPQISDVILLCGMVPGAVMMFLQRRPDISMVALTGGLFAALCVLVNLVNYIFIPDLKFLLAAAYYPYNFLIFMFVVFLFARDFQRMVKISLVGIAISLVVQVITAKFFPGMDGLRLTGNFRNPNQLAYWALLSAAMVVFLRQEKFQPVDFLIIGLAGYLQTLALSKAGLITFGLFLALLVFVPQMPRMARIGLAFLLMAGVSYFAFSAEGLQLGAAERVAERMQTFGLERDDSLSGRGYTRLWEAPQYLAIGAGEGGFERFQNYGGPKELHSGLATILFSYGVLGFGLFAAFLFYVFGRQRWYAVAVLGIVLLMSLTSQTIRFTHTWVFFGVAYAAYRVRKVEEASEPGGLQLNPSLQPR